MINWLLWSWMLICFPSRRKKSSYTITSFLDMEWLTPIGDGYICSYGLVWWMTWRLTERVEETTYKTQNTELPELKNANYLKLYLLSPFMKTCFLRKGPDLSSFKFIFHSWYYSVINLLTDSEGTVACSLPENK